LVAHSEIKRELVIAAAIATRMILLGSANRSPNWNRNCSGSEYCSWAWSPYQQANHNYSHRTSRVDTKSSEWLAL